MASMEEDLGARREEIVRRMAKRLRRAARRRLMNDPPRAGKTAAEIEMDKFMIEATRTRT